MILGIYANLQRDINGVNASLIASALRKEGIRFCLDKELSFLNIDAPHYPIEEMAKICDIIVTLGGDGTILGIAKHCAHNGCKIYGLNLGNLGFYTEPLDTECKKLIDYIKKGAPFVSDMRTLLSVEYNNRLYYALNEVVVARGARTKLIKLSVHINGSLAGNYKADGIILSTASGSTAYSLSAGGPIVIPDVAAFILTPLAPHSLQSRPYVVSENSVIKATLFSDEQPAHIHMDGNEIGQLNAEESIIIKKSDKYVEFVRFEGYDYYNRLSEKINKIG
jgi:NAD+ kinase